ncbi:MAG: tRNA lysidine(34) synthetase TilS, partial [Bacteroidota bacterium]
MQAELQKYIEAEQLFNISSERVIIAVSGGVDSIVLSFLLKELQADIALAHCNFMLRGKMSDEDEQFVKDFAQSIGVPFYNTRLATAALAKVRKTSIQVVARDLRYAWLEDLRMQHNYHYIATAHHWNDSIETALYNFT